MIWDGELEADDERIRALEQSVAHLPEPERTMRLNVEADVDWFHRDDVAALLATIDKLRRGSSE